MSEFNSDAQHPASQQRIQQAYNQGKFPRSQELNISIQLFCVFGAFHLFGQSVVNQFIVACQQYFEEIANSTLNVDNTFAAIQSLTVSTSSILIALLAFVFLIAVLSVLSQRRGNFIFQSEWINTQVANPANGVKRILSFKNFARSVLGLPKVVILLVVGAFAIASRNEQIFQMGGQSTHAILLNLIQVTSSVLLTCSATLLAISLLDYLLERFSFFESQRMTDQQLRDEQRMQETDPSVSQKRKQIHQHLAQRS